MLNHSSRSAPHAIRCRPAAPLSVLLSIPNVRYVYILAIMANLSIDTLLCNTCARLREPERINQNFGLSEWPKRSKIE